MIHSTEIHKHRRTRSKKMQPYPHHKFRYRLLDWSIDVVVIFMPLTLVPQVYEIWVNEATGGVSLLTWTLFTFAMLPLVVYDIVHRVKRLMIMHILLLLMYIGIVVGIIVN